ncbi:hypothetical protein BHM03_00009244 [Ensete ventricosum]|nr:hypothetical protein BHM03_00009244 [Ensete ventricosum]
MVAWDHHIVTYHRPATTVDVEPQEQDAPTTGGHEGASWGVVDQDPKTWNLSLEDKGDLKRTDLLGP